MQNCRPISWEYQYTMSLVSKGVCCWTWWFELELWNLCRARGAPTTQVVLWPPHEGHGIHVHGPPHRYIVKTSQIQRNNITFTNKFPWYTHTHAHTFTHACTHTTHTYAYTHFKTKQWVEMDKKIHKGHRSPQRQNLPCKSKAEAHSTSPVCHARGWSWSN